MMPSAPLVEITSAGPPSFDAHHPPEKSLLADCVHCGFCLPACPTYVLAGQEMDSPRGRIYMMHKVSECEAALDHTFQTHIDNCLGCMACMTACPSGVQYSKLLEDTRAQVQRNIPRNLSDRLFRRLLFATFPYASRLRLLALPMLVYQRLGIQRLLRGSGLLDLMPARLRAMESLLPTVPPRLFEKLPAQTTPASPRLRVGMLSGCVQQVFFQRVNRATLRVLVAEGCEVVIPETQSCCGALMVHSGLDEDARRMAMSLIETFEQANVDVVVINAAGCGSTMKEYGHLFRGDPVWQHRAEAFAARCRDISEVLVELRPIAPRHPFPMRIAYHDACHLRHAQGIFDEPRALLSAILSLEILEIAESSLCCGSAGVYNMLHPATAAELGDRKVTNLLATDASAVVSANPGCLLQLMSSLRRRGESALPAFHMVELVDASQRNLTPTQLLHECGYS